MLKRLNSTGRRKLEPHRVVITLDETVEPPVFSTRVDLSGLDLPAEALVVAEAYRGSASVRFELGRAGDLKEVSRTELREFRPDDALQFRLKVVDPQTQRLLALRQKIRPGDIEQSGRLPLLTVKEEDLGPEPWKVVFEAEDAVLLVNTDIPDAINKLRTPGMMQALVLPAAFRQVLLHLWARREEVLDEDGEPEGAVQRWLGFAEKLAGRAWEPNEEEPEAAAAWIDDACRAFASRHPSMMAGLVGGFGAGSDA